jgi:hypothetical protein
MARQIKKATFKLTSDEICKAVGDWLLKTERIKDGEYSFIKPLTEGEFEVRKYEEEAGPKLNEKSLRMLRPEG